MREILYLLGAPGAGKSTLMGALLKHLRLQPLPVESVAKLVQIHRLVGEDGLVQAQYLGRIRPSFPGTDALGMAASPRVIEYLSSERGPRRVLGEGARLGTGKFLGWAAEQHSLTVLLLDGPEALLQERRRARGSGQDEAWARSARTRALNAAEVAERLGASVHSIDISKTTEQQVSDAAEILVKAWGEL